MIRHFNIPKIHTRHHYPEFIQRVGSTLNFSTETPERYHIDIAKKAYQGVSRREYAAQMVRWLDRQEKLQFFDRYLKWRIPVANEPVNVECQPAVDNTDVPIPPRIPTLQLACRPRFSRVTQAVILVKFEIDMIQFQEAVKRYEVKRKLRGRASGRGWTYTVDKIPSIYDILDIWTLFRLTLPILDDIHDPVETVIVRADPGDKEKRPVFDTVFIDMEPEKGETQVGIKGVFPELWVAKYY